MIRAAAKNHAHVTVCVDPEDYDAVLASLGGSEDSPNAVQFRRQQAWKTYAHCASYDSMVNDWYWQQIGRLSFIGPGHPHAHLRHHAGSICQCFA